MVIDKLWRTFSDQGVVRKFHKDLLMTHCCVFACILDNFEVNLVDLAEDLKLEQNELGQYFKEIGARVQVSKSKERTQTVAYLSLLLVTAASVPTGSAEEDDEMTKASQSRAR